MAVHYLSLSLSLSLSLAQEMAYRVYKALFPFTSRDSSEVSMLPDDFLIVYQLDDGSWPNESAWMKGMKRW